MVAPKPHLFERQGEKMINPTILLLMIFLLASVFPLVLYCLKSEKALQMIEASVFSLVGGVSLIVKITNPLIFSNFSILDSILCLLVGAIAYLFASSKYRIIPLDIMAYSCAAFLALLTHTAPFSIFWAGIILQIGLLLYWIYLYKKDRSANPSETKTISKILTTPSESHIKTIQIFGYICCWFCAPVFWFLGALCDHGDICNVVLPTVALSLFGCIPLIIGQIALYRSKRTVPPFDALFFLIAAACGITVILLPVGMILWLVGFMLEIILLLYVLILAIVKEARQTPVEMQTKEKK